MAPLAGLGNTYGETPEAAQEVAPGFFWARNRLGRHTLRRSGSRASREGDSFRGRRNLEDDSGLISYLNSSGVFFRSPANFGRSRSGTIVVLVEVGFR